MCGAGGREALSQGFAHEATGQRSIYGERFSASDPPWPAAHFVARTAVQGPYLRIDWDNAILPDTPINKAAKFSEIVRGRLGFIVGTDNWLVTPTTDIPSGRVAAIRKQLLLTHPHLYLAMAIADPAIRATPQGGADGYEELVIDDGVLPTITVDVDKNSGHIVRLRTTENDHVFRDVAIEVTYGDWDEPGIHDGSLSLPRSVTLKGRGEVWYEEHRSRLEQDPGPASQFAFPAEARPALDEAQYSWGLHSSQFIQMWCTFGVSKNEQQLVIEPHEVAPGVFFLRGAMYNTVVVDQGASVVVVEAPLYPERSEAIRAWIAATLNKPISHVVVTHHHLDHVGGVRDYVAAKVPIVVGAAAVPILEEAARAPSTVVPDLQERVRATPTFVTLGEEDVSRIEAGELTVGQDVAAATVPPSRARENVVYTVPLRTIHADGARLIVIATGADAPTVLFQSDMFNPDDQTGRALNPLWAIELALDLDDLGQHRDGMLLLGGHSGYAPLDQLYTFVDEQIPPMFKAYVFYLRHQMALGVAAGLAVLGALGLLGGFIARRRRAAGGHPAPGGRGA